MGANTAAYYESRESAQSDKAPGLESLPVKDEKSPQTKLQQPAQQKSVPGPLFKSGVPAKAPAKKAVKKAAAKSEAEKAGIPASPTAPAPAVKR